MKEKLFGLLTNFRNLDHYLIAQKILLKKISENFEKFILIDTDKIEHFPRKTLFNWDRFSKTKIELKKTNENIPNNFIIFQPNNLKEFESFISSKDLILIDNIEHQFNYFKIFRLLKKYKIKQLITSNIANNDAEMSVKNLTEKIRLFMGKMLPRKIYKLLCMVNYFNKIDIRFDCNKNLLKYWNDSIIKRRYLFFKGGYVKKFVPVNSRAYDQHHTLNLKQSEEYIVLIDANLNDKEEVAVRGKLSEQEITKHYNLLGGFLDQLSKLYKKKIVVCIHPGYDLLATKKRFKNIEVYKYRSSEFISKAFIVVLYESTMILDAFFLKKNIIVLKPDFPSSSSGFRYNRDYGIPYLDLENKETKNLSKNKLDDMLLKAKKNYDNFIKTHIKIDENELGSDKIIRIIKEKYF